MEWIAKWSAHKSRIYIFAKSVFSLENIAHLFHHHVQSTQATIQRSLQKSVCHHFSLQMRIQSADMLQFIHNNAIRRRCGISVEFLLAFH